MNQIKEIINSILCEVLENEQLVLEDKTDLYVEYGLDSIGMMGALVRLENSLEVTVPDEKLVAENLRYYGNFYKLMERLVEEKESRK